MANKTLVFRLINYSLGLVLFVSGILYLLGAYIQVDFESMTGFRISLNAIILIAYLGFVTLSFFTTGGLFSKLIALAMILIYPIALTIFSNNYFSEFYDAINSALQGGFILGPAVFTFLLGILIVLANRRGNGFLGLGIGSKDVDSSGVPWDL